MTQTNTNGEKAVKSASHRKQLVKNENGIPVGHRVTFTIQHDLGKYDYDFLFSYGTSDAEIDSGLEKLKTHAEKQSAKQKDHNSLYNTDIISSGLTALVTDSVVHIEGLGQVAHYLRFYIREKQQWVKKDWRAADVDQLPTTRQVTDFIEQTLAQYVGA